MIDGFGVPESGWNNSIYSKYCSSRFIELLSDYSVALDATLGVDGIPQSATGQTALFTGINAAEILNRHISGFPGAKLCEIISNQNIFDSLIKRNLKVAFANAYVRHSLEELSKMRFKSVTTVMAELSLGEVKSLNDLLNGDAIYHDITRESLASKKESIDMITSESAAYDLAIIASKHDFVLFEYFLTDRAGHKMDEAKLGSILDDFSRFFVALIDNISDDIGIVLVSDHGNCEDISIKQHTLNPVPLFVYNLPSVNRDEVFAIDHVYNYILNQYSVI